MVSTQAVSIVAIMLKEGPAAIQSKFELIVHFCVIPSYRKTNLLLNAHQGEQDGAKITHPIDKNESLESLGISEDEVKCWKQSEWIV